MTRSIPISQKHGVNPSLILCPCCGESTGVALMGRLKDDQEAPRHCPDVEPCEKCKTQFAEYKKQGFVLYIIRDEYDDNQKRATPWQFYYGVVVITYEARDRLFHGADFSKGSAYLPLSLANRLGLYKSDAEEVRT